MRLSTTRTKYAEANPQRMIRAQSALISVALRSPSRVFEFEMISSICFKECTYVLKINLFRYLIFLKTGGSSSATIMDEASVERRALLSVPRFTASWKTAQNHAKVFLRELHSAPLVIKTVQYRRYMYERVLNIAVLIGKKPKSQFPS